MVTSFILFVLPVFAVISAILYIPIYFVNKKKYGKRPFLRHFAIYVLIGIILSILHATIFIYGVPIQFTNEYHLLNLQPFYWLAHTYDMGFQKMLEQLMLNICMLVPLGFILPIVFQRLRRCWKTFLIIIVFILSIETLQYFIGRSADIDDVIMNTIGGIIGYGCYRLVGYVFKNMKWWNRMQDS